MVLPAILQDILIGQAKLMGNNTVKYSLPGRVDVGGTVTARDIMIATGSVPFVPPGIPIDGKTVSCPDKLLSPERTCSQTLCSMGTQVQPQKHRRSKGCNAAWNAMQHGMRRAACLMGIVPACISKQQTAAPWFTELLLPSR